MKNEDNSLSGKTIKMDEYLSFQLNNKKSIDNKYLVVSNLVSIYDHIRSFFNINVP